MKKIITMFVILSLLASVFSPTTAFAAEPKKTIAQRFAAIEETYGIGMMKSQGEIAIGVLAENPNSKYEEAILTNLETALALTGASFMKSLNKATANERKLMAERGRVFTDINYKGENIKGLSINIITNDYHNVAYYSDFNIMLGGKYLPTENILHAISIAFLNNNVGADKNPRGNFAGQKYGKYQTAPAGFLSTWAAQSWTNDYCSVFAYMVLNNENNKLTPNTVLWKKGKTVYDDLVKYAGTGARATQRAAANLGIEIKKD